MKRLLIALFGICLTLAVDNAALAWPKIDPSNVSPDTTFLLRDAVRHEIERIKPGLYFAIIAEAERGDVRAAIVWPALYRGKFIDDDIIALIFRRDGQKWISIKKEIKLSSAGSREKFADAMGGPDYKVIKPDGLANHKLPSHLMSEISRLHEALEREQSRDAIDAIESLSRAFSLNMAAFDDAFAEMLIESSSVRASLDLNRFAADKENVRADSDMTLVFRDGAGNLLREVRLKVNLVRIGSGWAIDEVKDPASRWSVGGS
jgi:hypothetical protein